MKAPVCFRKIQADFCLRVLHTLTMNNARRLFLVGLVIFLSGCGPKEPAVPAVPEVDEAVARREQYFGAEAKTPGIDWRSSGLGIRILVPGAGPSPKMTDTIRVHYIGRLKDGTVFDDSHPRGPADFVVNQLIAGWSAAMPSLKAGGKAVIFVPPYLGYGGIRAGKIPPDSGLIFEVELIAVNP